MTDSGHTGQLQSSSARRQSPRLLAVLIVCAAVPVGVSAAVWVIQDSSLTDEPSNESSAPVLPKRFAETIRKPSGPPIVQTGINDIHGAPVTAACSTCHTTRKPNPANRTATDLKEFHRGLKMAHGSVSCLSCHNSDDYDTLKLADGSSVGFPDVMTLCAQCHGPQMRDYEHGAHGGMNGYWDTTRGPRNRLNCIDCHDPHAPKFPKMRPTFKPKDRFLSQSGDDH